MLSNWLQNALKDTGIKQAHLARLLTEKLGRSIDRAAVNKMISGARKIAADEMIAISDILNVAMPNSEEVVLGPVEVPLFGWVSAGQLANEDLRDEVIGQETVAGLPVGDWIALRVEGDSMDRISPPDSIIIVNRNDKRLVANACYVIADPDGNATYKRYRPNPPRFEPVSTNPAHEPIFPENDPLIIGRVRMTILRM